MQNSEISTHEGDGRGGACVFSRQVVKSSANNHPLRTHPGVVVDVDDPAVYIPSFPVCDIYTSKQEGEEERTNRCSDQREEAGWGAAHVYKTHACCAERARSTNCLPSRHDPAQHEHGEQQRTCLCMTGGERLGWKPPRLRPCTSLLQAADGCFCGLLHRA